LTSTAYFLGNYKRDPTIAKGFLIMVQILGLLWVLSLGVV